MDDVDLGIRQGGLKAGVRHRQSQTLGRGLGHLRAGVDHAAHLDAQAAQRLDMNGADEAAADDGRADVAETLH